MKIRSRIITASGLLLILILSVTDLAGAYGYNFVFPSARRSTVSGYTYADPINPGHLAWDYRFSMHTKVAAAQKGWIATSYWNYPDGHEPPCDGNLPARGNFIILNHTSDDRSENTGLETWYFHLSNTGNRPAPGAYFPIGQYMAYSGDTGCGEAHLHFATKNNGTPFDPYAGYTNWVSGQPIPMGFRDQNGAIHGPFALDNAKIRDKWLNLQGSPGAPIQNTSIGVCPTQAESSLLSPTMYKQRFERGYIYYCGTGSAVYAPYSVTHVPGVRGRYTCGAGDNSVIVVENISSGSATVNIIIHNSDGTIRDSRVRNTLLEPGGQWVINVHEILFDWLILGTNMGGTFNGDAYVYSDQSVAVNHSYTVDEDCKYLPSILRAYPPP